MTRRTIRTWWLAGALAACTVSGEGSMSVESPAIVYQAPPPAQAETVTVRSGFLWVKGRWTWQNGQWVWKAGRWEHERAGYAWREGRWEKRGYQWVWVDGTWMVASQPTSEPASQPTSEPGGGSAE